LAILRLIFTISGYQQGEEAGPMTLELSKEQYRNLIKLVYAGNWLINAHRSAKDRIEDFDELEQYILSKYDQFEAQDIIFHDDYDDRYYYTGDFEEEIMEFATDYDDHVFWDELVCRLALKEAVKKYKNPTNEQIWQMEDQLTQEFYEHGLDRLEINPGSNENNKNNEINEK